MSFQVVEESINLSDGETSLKEMKIGLYLSCFFDCDSYRTEKGEVRCFEVAYTRGYNSEL